MKNEPKTSRNFVETRKEKPCHRCLRVQPIVEYYLLYKVRPDGPRMDKCKSCMSWLHAIKYQMEQYDCTEEEAIVDLELKGREDPKDVYRRELGLPVD